MSDDTRTAGEPEKPLRILHLEDVPADAELIQAALESDGIPGLITWVKTRNEFENALRTNHYDLILSDYKLPGYDGLTALRLVKAHYADTPFIFISGTMGEDAAIQSLTEGGTDYVLKHKLARLAPAIKRELVFAEDRRERKRMEEKLIESELKFKTLFNTAGDAIFTMNHSVFLDCNITTEKIFRCSREQIVGHSPVEFSPERQPDGSLSSQSALEKIEAAFEGQPQFFEWLHTHLDGTPFYAEVNLNRVFIGSEFIVQAIVRDIDERKKAEGNARKRMKELIALYGLAELAQREGITLGELYKESANILSKSYRYAEIACARLVIGDSEFRTENFAESLWMQSASIMVNREVVGRIEVGYLEERPEEGEGPFLEEERFLIDAIAERLGHITARKRVEEAQRLRARWSEALLQLLQFPLSSEKEIVAYAVETLVALTESKLCFIGLVDSEETTMSGHVWSQHAMQECAVFDGKPVQFDVAQGGLWTAPIRQHQSIIVNDYAAAHPLKKGYPAGHVSLTRFLGVPVIREGRAVLVAGLANKVEEYRELEVSETLMFLEGLWGVLNRNRAVDELRLKNLVFDASIAANSIADLTGVITEANDAFRRMWAYPGKDEVVGKPLPRFFNDPNEAVAILAALNGTGRWEGVFSAVRSDGSVFAAHGLATILRDSQGSIVGYQSSVLDITERVQAEKHLTDLHLRHEQVLDAAAEGILGLDSNGTHTFVNPAAATMLGYKVEELLGRPSHSLWHHTRADGSAYPKEQCEILACLRQGVVLRAHSDLFWRKDGTSFPVEFACSPIAQDGPPVATVVTFSDITERKQAAEELQGTLERLKKAINTTIQVMISAIEVRDPYTAGHQLRSANLARTIATEMELPPNIIDGIRMAGSIHDLGKLSVPAEIMSKPTKLTAIEFSLIKEHSRNGYEMLKDVESPWPLAEIVYQHHEQMDGSGYPRNLKGEEIMIEARILAVADVAEAMASYRPYRPALGIDAVIEEIEKNKGILYDPGVSEVCLRLFREKGFGFE